MWLHGVEDLSVWRKHDRTRMERCKEQEEGRDVGEVRVWKTLQLMVYPGSCLFLIYFMSSHGQLKLST